MKAIVVDNDLMCIDTLTVILKNSYPGIVVLGTATNVADAVRLINEVQPEIIFLDVELDSEVGFDLIRYFPDPTFDIIFTTAYEKYAIQAIKSACFDYLLKPINVQELISTLKRLELHKSQNIKDRAAALIFNTAQKNLVSRKLAIPYNDSLQFINIHDIVCLQADAKYTKIFTSDGQSYLSSKNIGEYEDLLLDPVFYRSHKSWIINVSKIISFNKADLTVLLTNSLTADVSVRKKDDFFNLFLK